MRYPWDAWARSHHVTFRPKAFCSALRFSEQLRREVASWKANLEVVLVCGGFLGLRGQQASIVQDTTAVSPLYQQDQHPLARLLHLTTTYTTFDRYINPTDCNYK